MKTLVFALGLACALAICPAANASPLTFYVTNGTFDSGGTFSGYYTIDSVTDKILGGQFTLDDFGATSTEVWLRTPPDSIGYFNTDAMFSGGAGLFFFSVSTNLNAPVLCTYLNDPTCGTGDDTALQYGTEGNFDSANGATISPTPEPSSLILLATGALGIAAVVRLRMRSASPRL